MAEADIPKAALALAYLALSSELETQLKRVAADHGGRDGKWLENIEISLVEGIKRSSSQGVSEDDEFKAMRGAIVFIEGFFANLRAQLLAKGDA